MGSASQVRTSKNQGREQDRELVATILAGDEQAFTALYRMYHQRVVGFALRRVGNPSDAEDIAQEVFLQIHRSLGSYQGRASLSTWIFGIAHNVTCRHFRGSGQKTVSLEQNPAAEHKLVETPNAERKIDAARAVDRCTTTLAKTRTPDHLEIFRLFYGHGRPLRSIARTTGRPTDSIKDSLRRSRNLLVRDLPDLRSALAATGA